MTQAIEHWPDTRVPCGGQLVNRCTLLSRLRRLLGLLVSQSAKTPYREPSSGDRRQSTFLEAVSVVGLVEVHESEDRLRHIPASCHFVFCNAILERTCRIIKSHPSVPMRICDSDRRHSSSTLTTCDRGSDGSIFRRCPFVQLREPLSEPQAPADPRKATPNRQSYSGFRTSSTGDSTL